MAVAGCLAAPTCKIRCLSGSLTAVKANAQAKLASSHACVHGGPSSHSSAVLAARAADTWVVGNVAAGLNLRTPLSPAAALRAAKEGQVRETTLGWGTDTP
jgi:hypothetical protein